MTLSMPVSPSRPHDPDPAVGAGAAASARSVAARTSAPGLTWLDARDPAVEAVWRTLEAAARPAYFLTWGWIENWLAALPTESMPRLAVIHDRGQAIAAGFFGRRRWLRHGVMPVRGLYLNATGIPRLDELCIEHNGLLCRPTGALPLAALVGLLPRDWDELVLPGIAAGELEPRALGEGLRLVVDGEVPAPFVDLERVRQAGDYLALLGSNTRAQIRRARREVGRCELEVAGSVGQALAIYDELIALHTESWRERGEPGVFADPWFTRVHRRLIERRFAHGETELLRLRAGGKTIGCTYNLISNQRVLFYQSGLARSTDPHVKPGYLCQAAAIERAAATGAATYDLLAGEARYKTSLSTGTTRLAWLRVQRRLARFAIEDRARQWKRAFVAWRAAPAT
jgi:CelD/BcsL family acetyltransferase involved in cellulose biosynthesis